MSRDRLSKILYPNLVWETGAGVVQVGKKKDKLDFSPGLNEWRSVF